MTNIHKRMFIVCLSGPLCQIIHSCLNLQSDRLHKVLDLVSTVHDLCAVLGMDFFSTVTEVHPSLDDSTGIQSKSISNDTLSNLANTVLVLKEDKKQRLLKVNVLIVSTFMYTNSLFLIVLLIKFRMYQAYSAMSIVQNLDPPSRISLY